jgi:hypothetical protein
MVKILKKPTLEKTDLPPAMLRALTQPSLPPVVLCAPPRTGQRDLDEFQWRPPSAFECRCGARRKPLNPYCAREATKALVATIEKGDLPADVVETEAFRDLLEVICPTYVIPTRREILAAVTEVRARNGSVSHDVDDC